MAGGRRRQGAIPLRATFPARLARFGSVALLAPAALAVHQLRYMLAFGADAGIQLQRTGHSYLHSIVPWIVLLVALAAGGFLRALGRAFAGQTTLPRYTVSLAGMWLACSACLIAIFGCQEFLEGLFATGHPAGPAGIFGYGGWWSIPAAACVGMVLAAWLHGARWILREVARRRPFVPSLGVGPAPRVPRPCQFALAPPAPLVAGWSGRGPPA
jgi:hypothetical protein